MALLASPSAFAAKEHPPRVVHVGAYFNQVHALSLRDNNFEVDFYLWFRWDAVEWGERTEEETTKPGAPVAAASTDEAQRLPFETFEIMGSVETTKEVQSRAPGYAALRVKSKITEYWDVSRFPFDDHVLAIRVESIDQEEHLLRYELDQDNSGVGSELRVAGWAVGKPRTTLSTGEYRTNFGDLNLPTKNHSLYTRGTFELPLHRRGWGSFLKLFGGLAVAVAVALTSYFIRAKEVDPRFGLCVGSLFAAVASQYVVASVLPESPTFTLADRLHLVAFAVVLIGIVESAVALHYLSRDTEEDERLVQRMDRVTFALVTALWLGVSALLVYQARAS